jgi:hypothetical protein
MLKEFVDFIQNERGNLMKAPATFVMLSVLSLGLGYAGGLLYYSSQVNSLHEQLNAKDAQLGRYRVALGIDPASKGALVELNNQELALKAQSIVAALRQFNSELDQKCAAIDQRANSGEIDKNKVMEAKRAAAKEIFQDFDRSLAADTYNVENELRKRLSPEAMGHIVRVPAFIEGNDLNNRVTLSRRMLINCCCALAIVPFAGIRLRRLRRIDW